MNEGQPSRPANVENIVAINQGRKPLAMALPDLPALNIAKLQELAEQGAHIVDCRSEAAFGAGHIPGAFNLQLSSSEFEQRVGWVLPGDSRLVLVSEGPTEAAQAQKAMAFIGLESRLAGYLAGGMDAWQAAGLPVVQLPQVPASELLRMVEAGEVTVLDVRESSEWNEGHIHGALHMRYRDLPAGHERLRLDRDQKIAITCAGGYRSSTAGSILQRLGYTNLLNLTGGMDNWKRSGLPVD